MKLSISVPDDLWQEARSVGDTRNPSHVVQEALRRWVESAKARPPESSSLPGDVADAMAEVKARFTIEARAEFEKGYRAGIKSAQDLTWAEVETLAERFGFNIRAWENARGSDILTSLGASDPRYEWRSPTFLKGLTQALRDLWAEIAAVSEPADESNLP